jgi:glycosyltransferase involved in cell wall biosynthesis
MNDRLRVVMVPDWYPSPEAPVSAPFMQDLARAIALTNSVTVLAPPSADAPRESSDGDVRVIRLPMTGLHGKLAALARLRAVNAALVGLEKEGWKPDILHGHVFSGAIVVVIVAMRRRLPTVITENASVLLGPGMSGWDTRVARFTYRHADVVCPVSTLLARRLASLQPRGRYEVVPDVVDVDTFAPREHHTSGSRAHVVSVAMLHPRKGLRYLIDAIRLLTMESWDLRLSIIGDGPERAALEARARDLPISFLGLCSRQDVVATLRTADAFALPTLADPFGISAVEAMAAGVPAIVTSACGSADLVEKNGGVVVPPGDAARLAEALELVLDRRPRVAPGAIDTLRDACGPAAVSERLDAIYRSVSHLPRGDGRLSR